MVQGKEIGKAGRIYDPKQWTGEFKQISKHLRLLHPPAPTHSAEVSDVGIDI